MCDILNQVRWCHLVWGEDGSEAFDGQQLCPCAVRCDVSPDGFGQRAEAVDDAVFRRQTWARHCWMLEDDCVIDGDMLGGVFNDFVASVMLQGGSYVESGAAAEIPRASGGSLYM